MELHWQHVALLPDSVIWLYYSFAYTEVEHEIICDLYVGKSNFSPILIYNDFGGQTMGRRNVEQSFKFNQM